ncbi:wax ester/triacylglycerol synthase family O-acyltransferase [Nocardia sp. R6R-6]|uniref:wax ester/triacylglycerol synthase family O-acyltransferase n=1 Tax=Nocardia sp. R6R-6 TaxID=3459303 RepID=UPI00403D9114
MTIEIAASHHLRIETATPGDRLTAEPNQHAAPRMLPISGESGPPRQLSSLDAQLLNLESSMTPLHVGALTTLDPQLGSGNPVTVAALRQLIAGRLHTVAPLRWRLRTVPLGLDLPYWDDCAQVDLGYHVRDVRLPEGSSDEQLTDLVARLHAQPLNRRRPLWECHLISGLSDGRQAIYTKVHHAVVDGVSAAEIMAVIMDVVAESPEVPVPAAGVRLDRSPAKVEMLGRGLAHTITRQADRLTAPLRLGGALREAWAGIRKANPDVPFNAPNTARRSFAFVSLPLDEVKAVKNAFGSTVNDVVVALCTSALRRWLIEHDVNPEKPLLAAVPVSVRTPEQIGTAGNQFSIMLCELPINEPEAQHRMKLVHEELTEVKERFRAGPSTALHQATAVIPQLLHGAATRAAVRVAAPALPLANLIISNVPGPQIPLYAAGARVTGSFPISLLTELTGGLNITVMSYDGHIDFGILACADSVPDVGDIAEYLTDALRELE